MEDDHDVRVLVRELLEGAGWGVTTTANGRDALTMLRAGTIRPSLLLVDLAMPILDGWELIDAVRADPTLRRLPIGVSTAQPRERIPLDVDFVLHKPINPTTLLDVVARVILPRAAQ